MSQAHHSSVVSITIGQRERQIGYLYVRDPALGIDQIEEWWFDDVGIGLRNQPTVSDDERHEIIRQLTDIARSAQ